MDQSFLKKKLPVYFFAIIVIIEVTCQFEAVALEPGTEVGPDAKTGYNCAEIPTCGECLKYPCAWNKHSIQCAWCTLNEDGKCDQSLLNNTFLTADIVNSKSDSCASVSSDISLLVPSGQKRAIRVKIHFSNTEKFLIQALYRCQFTIGSLVKEAEGRLLGDTVYCNDVEFSYKEKKPRLIVPFKILSGRVNYSLENYKNDAIEVYKCEEMGNDCKSCKDIDSKYGCGWCEHSKSCTVSDSCSGSWMSQSRLNC